MSIRTPSNLDACLNIADLKALAYHCLPNFIAPYLEGAAEDALTAQRNISAFDEVAIFPRALVNVAAVDTRASIFGQPLEWPLLCSPTGASRLFHPRGELAVASAAAHSGSLYGLSSMATHSLEQVAAASAGAKFFQLFIFKDRDFTREIILRCRHLGYRALCLTVDSPVRGNCETEIRHGVARRFSVSGLASLALHPHWALGQLRAGAMTAPLLAKRAGANDFATHSRYLGEQLDTSITWRDARDLIELWNGPFAIKGIMRADDARRAADIGATAVIVSNHGGRQLDGAAATLEALPAIAAAVGDKLEVILEGGIRRGGHILKALALGAKACSIGRPILFGLSAGGEAGVRKALSLLRTELVRAMQLAGCAKLSDIDGGLLQSAEALP